MPWLRHALIMGVAVRRAVTLIGFGAVVGLFVGGMVTSVVIKSLVDPSAATAVDPADGVAKPVASAAAGPSAIPVASAIPVPPAAMSALRQTAILNGRIAEDATALSRLGGSGTANDIAQGPAGARRRRGHRRRHRRRGSRPGRAPRPCPATAPPSIRAITASAHASLGDSISDTKAYRANAKSMLKVLARLAALDAASRTLAAVGRGGAAAGGPRGAQAKVTAG